MKPIFALSVFVLVCGCGQKSPFDVSQDQIKKHQVVAGGPPDLDHLPPGAKKEVQTFKKGDRLPDGTIATGPVKLVRVQMSDHGRTEEAGSLSGPGPSGGRANPR